jgi:heptosyltransferase-2/heptosyltransferase-3
MMTAPSPFVPLVVRFGAFGDMILIVPMLKVLSRRYGHPCEVVCSGSWAEPLLQRVPAAGRRFLLTSRRAPYWFNGSQRRLVAWLRRRPPGPVYVFEPDEKCHWLLRRGGIKSEWICSLRDLPRRPGEHIMAHALRLARETPPALRAFSGAAADPTFTPDARPVLTEEDRRDCREWLAQKSLARAPLMLAQPGNKRTMRRGARRRDSNIKYWPEENWGRVIAGVRKILPSSRVLICGSPAERTLAEDIGRHSGCDGVMVATDDLPIPRLFALLEHAHSMISVDTGPAHAAATMGCPLVVLFARTDPQLYAPVATSAPVRIVSPDPAVFEASLLSIPPEAVLAAWRELTPA